MPLRTEEGLGHAAHQGRGFKAGVMQHPTEPTPIESTTHRTAEPVRRRLHAPSPNLRFLKIPPDRSFRLLRAFKNPFKNLAHSTTSDHRFLT